MDAVAVLLTTAALLELGRAYLRWIRLDGYGSRPPPRSHVDPFTGRPVR